MLVPAVAEREERIGRGPVNRASWMCFIVVEMPK